MFVVGDRLAGQVPGHNISICFVDMHFSRYHFYNFNPEKRQFWILKCGEWTPKGTRRGGSTCRVFSRLMRKSRKTRPSFSISCVINFIAIWMDGTCQCSNVLSEIWTNWSDWIQAFIVMFILIRWESDKGYFLNNNQPHSTELLVMLYRFTFNF